MNWWELRGGGTFKPSVQGRSDNVDKTIVSIGTVVVFPEPPIALFERRRHRRRRSPALPPVDSAPIPVILLISVPGQQGFYRITGNHTHTHTHVPRNAGASLRERVGGTRSPYLFQKIIQYLGAIEEQK